MPWLFYHQGKVSWYKFYKRLGGHHIQSDLEAKTKFFYYTIEPPWKYFPYIRSVVRLTHSHLWFCCSFWNKLKKSIKNYMERKNIQSCYFLLNSCFCFWEVLLHWSSLCIHKTRETTVQASFHLIQVHFKTGFTLELNNCEKAVIATVIDREALSWEYLTCISNATIIPSHYIGTSYYEHLILMRHMTCYIMQKDVCEQQASQTFSSSCWY